MANQIFIAREKQLDQLNACLQRALAGQGNVCFVSGEAGSGKTTLVTEFTRRALDQNQDLAVAVGQCDAETGAGDAHLPFREIMAQLTGDVESKLAQGAITKENASRLRKLLVLSGQALVDVGPDLIGIFVPGIGLATRIGGFVAEKAGWLDKLEKLVNKPKAEPGDSGLKESHIFEQFANVLCQLSQKHPLVLVLDDLHWADEASISLLFHLGRRINEHKILLLGTYRSAEVAIGRAGERHPLEKVLAEFKRYFGDITVDLDQAVKQEGYEFVTAFLASEPHALRADFATSLYHHTGGHPLFTVELLRNLQERGDLVQDEQGRWIESGSLDWESLPKRVEGVIQERIGRLQKELRQILTVGSVQGEDFTAEVIASVQQAEARDLVRRLGSELERQHKLVLSQGIQRLDLSGQRLSRFRFQHNLFRTYLYNELNESERAYLHEDVGNALETLYGDQADEVAVQLSLHFEIAGLNEKARYYLQEAGKQAAIRYANDEALDYFSRAISLTPENDLEDRYNLLMLQERLHGLKSALKDRQAVLDQLKRITEALGEDHKKAEVCMREASYAIATSDFPAAIAATQQAIRLAEASEDSKILSHGFFTWGNAARLMGNYDLARSQMERAFSLAQNAGFKILEAGCLRGLGAVAQEQADTPTALKYDQDSLIISRKEGDRFGTGKTLNNLGLIFSSQGNFDTALAHFSEALEIFKEVGDRRSESVILGNIGVAYAEMGNLQSAGDYFLQTLAASRVLGNRENECHILNNLGNMAAQMGDLQASRKYLEEALPLTREIGAVYSEIINLNSIGLTLLQLGEFSTAEEKLRKSVSLAQELKIPDFESSALIKLGALHDSLGDFKVAQDYLDAGLKILCEISDEDEQANFMTHQALLYHHTGQNNQACQASIKAIASAHAVENPETEATAWLYCGHAQAALTHLDEAQAAYEKGLKIREEIEQEFKCAEIRAGMARVALQKGEPLSALTQAAPILTFLETHSLDGTEEPLRIYLTCYQVLKANNDPRASGLLRTAHAKLMEQAGNTQNETLRQSFLENVAANREIIEAYANLAE